MILAVMLVFFVGIPLFMGRPSFEQYKYYSAAIKNSTFDVLKVEIEDKNLETYSWILKNFGTIQVSQMNYHSFEKGETVYIVYVPYKEGKYLFTDWIYSAKDYYRE